MLGSREPVPVQRITVVQIDENLGPYKIECDAKFKVKDNDIVIGAHVRLRDGKTGCIRHIDDTDKFIGVELVCVSHKGHCGRGHFQYVSPPNKRDFL